MAGTSRSEQIRVVEATPIIDTSAYASGDSVGSSVIALSGATMGDEGPSAELYGGYIQSVIVTDLGKQSANLDIVFFDKNPSATSFSDNNVFDINDADIVNIIGTVAITDWKDFNDNSQGQALNLTLPFVLEEGNTILYAAIVSRGVPNYDSAADLTLRVSVLSG